MARAECVLLRVLDVADDARLGKALSSAQTSERKYFEDLAAKDGLDESDAQSLQSLCERLEELVPGGTLHHRRAGRGSLGRVRIFALNKSQPPLAVEAKRVLRSAWSWASRGGPAHPDADDDRNDDVVALLTDTHRRPDPMTSVEHIAGHQWMLRPLSPDRVGIDFADIKRDLARRLLYSMGAELANIHALSADQATLASSVDALGVGWLAKASDAMKADTNADRDEWHDHGLRAAR